MIYYPLSVLLMAGIWEVLLRKPFQPCRIPVTGNMWKGSYMSNCSSLYKAAHTGSSVGPNKHKLEYPRCHVGPARY
jgi:hypothetical protein